VRQRNELVPRRQIFARSQQARVNDLAAIPKFEKARRRDDPGLDVMGGKVFWHEAGVFGGAANPSGIRGTTDSSGRSHSRV
jgi:hypothetical protein